MAMIVTYYLWRMEMVLFDWILQWRRHSQGWHSVLGWAEGVPGFSSEIQVV